MDCTGTLVGEALSFTCTNSELLSSANEIARLLLYIGATICLIILITQLWTKR